MSTTTVTSAAIVGIVLVAAVIGGVLGLHFWRKRVERLQAKALPAPEPQPIGPPLPTPLAPEAAAMSPQQQYHQRNASSPPPPPEMTGMPRVPVPTPMYIQAARRSRSIHLVSPDGATASPVSPVWPASTTSFPQFYPSAGTAPPSSVPLPDSTRTSLYLSEKDVEAGIASSSEEVDNKRSSSGSGGVRGFIRRMASVKNGGSRVDEEEVAAGKKA
ncbi:hypothetical protein BKA81DRAFT_408063 [Phyllosticta paracitricarpa]|uniref:Uncharacterized protein n=1 Tax=Phyllosticta paracitricarpa TaxID=2016321 RepID=A0ABR1MYU7_9PEZI